MNRLEAYKFGVKKYGLIKWNLSILLSPFLILAMLIARILQGVGAIGDQLERSIKRL